MGGAPTAARRPMARHVGVTDAEHRWVAVSDDLAALLGYKPAELVGRDSTELVVLPDPAGAEAELAFAELERSGHLEGSSVLRARDGRHFVYTWAMQAVGNGSGRYWVTVGAPLDGSALPAAGRLTVLTKQECAAIARVTVRTIERAMLAGALHAGGPRGARRIRLQDLETWMFGALALVVLALAPLGPICLACALAVEPAQDVMRWLGCPFAMR